ncbi:uncharacterized protein LOC129566330 [Sitodiplosis mosellana]|uniref:uncharacterized protein LOC129566330 n=1 Tax=Sitodiplosis mosellana TaxID=263140 RepID=UPI00244519CE|nr:uncharacterized protein LOC129566330 [Sitodiplosis mosellana]
MFGKSSEKYLLIAGVFAIVLIDTCYSSTFITPPIQHPEYPGKCFEPVTMRLLNPGQDVFLPIGCMKLTCLNHFGFAGAGCASTEEAIGKNCREVEGDRTKNYPNCCPRIVCDEDQDSDLFEYGTNSL